MAKLTFKNLSDGISLALSRAYPKANVFCKKALQQVSPGDFNVVPVSIIPLEKLNTLVKYKVLFDIIYFPIEGDECDDCLRVATDLPLILETIETPGGAKVHCINDITINIVDEVLHCSATYQYVVFAKRVPAKVDENGDPITDENGNPIVDEDGDPVVDEEAERDMNPDKMYYLENSDKGVVKI